jgi:hypothetical protein
MLLVRSIILTFALSCAAWAADPLIGTWSVNVQKSETASGRPAEAATQTFEAV